MKYTVSWYAVKQINQTKPQLMCFLNVGMMKIVRK